MIGRGVPHFPRYPAEARRPLPASSSCNFIRIHRLPGPSCVVRLGVCVCAPTKAHDRCFSIRRPPSAIYLARYRYGCAPSRTRARNLRPSYRILAGRVRLAMAQLSRAPESGKNGRSRSAEPDASTLTKTYRSPCCSPISPRRRGRRSSPFNSRCVIQWRARGPAYRVRVLIVWSRGAARTTPHRS